MQGIEKKTSAFFLVECDVEFGNNKKPWKYIYICICCIYNIINIYNIYNIVQIEQDISAYLGTYTCAFIIHMCIK